MWKSPKPREDVDILQDYDGPIYVHAPYLINVATPNNKFDTQAGNYSKTLAKLQQVLVPKQSLSMEDLVEKVEILASYENWRKAIEHVEDTGMRVLVENTAGGKPVARYMDSIERLWEVIGDLSIGLCLDTYTPGLAAFQLKKQSKGLKNSLKK